MMNAHQKTAATVALAATAVVCSIEIAVGQQGTQLPIRVPPPLTSASRPSQGFGPAYAYAGIASGRGEIIVIAQVLHVTPRPDNRLTPAQVLAAAHPKNVWDIPMAAAGRLAVIEQLTGQPGRVPRILSVTNPPLEQGFFGHGDRVVTRRMRAGELWLLAWDPKTGKVDVDGTPGAGRLSGPDDPELAMFRLDQRWLHKLDRDTALAEMTAAAVDSRQPIGVRKFALGGVMGAAYDPHLRAPRGPMAAHFWHLEAELLRRSDTPADLRLAALGYLSIDASRPAAPGSDEAFLLHYLVRLLDTSSDLQAVRVATERAYEANMQSGPFVNGKQTVYLYPEIIAALERRAQSELAQNPGRGGPAYGMLNNLSLVGRRGADQAVKGGAHVVQRLLPAAE